MLKECTKYASFHFKKEKIEEIKDKLLNEHKNTLENLFSYGKIIKDILQNALLTILTSDDENDQKDNFELLNIKYWATTPLIILNFNNDDKHILDMNELTHIYCSRVYMQNFQKTFEEFIPNYEKNKVPNDKLKNHIKNYFENNYIYFCDLPENVMALTIHTGNVYLKAKYLEEYFNKTDKESLLIVREKIILNIGHELAHILLRIINEEMKKNFLVKSNNKNSTEKNKIIQFKDKFKQEWHQMDMNESGNILDYNFFNKYYFDALFPDEAKFFFGIKNFTSVNDYYTQLDKIINNEKCKNLVPQQVNKFKKLESQKVRWCIRSRILGTVRMNEDGI